MAFRDYLIGEVAEEFAEGILSRREALRRLVLLGVGLSGATAVLSACGGGDDDPASASGEPSVSAAPPASTPGPDAGERITFDVNGTELTAAFKAASGTAKGALLVVHENKGLTTHFYDLVGRMAGLGYTSLCVDLVSRAGGTASKTDPAEATAALNEASLEEQLGDLKAGIDLLLEREPGVKVGAVGFCFGGARVWSLLDAGEKRIRAALPFYGTPPEDGFDLSDAEAAVLAVYGGTDERVNATLPAVRAALKDADLTHEVKVYDGAGHAFFNDTGERYDATAAADAQKRMLDWLEEHLA